VVTTLRSIGLPLTVVITTPEIRRRPQEEGEVKSCSELKCESASRDASFQRSRVNGKAVFPSVLPHVILLPAASPRMLLVTSRMRR
jgi:hypothetical protein